MVLVYRSRHCLGLLDIGIDVVLQQILGKASYRRMRGLYPDKMREQFRDLAIEFA